MVEIIVFITGLVLDRLSKMWISSNFVGKSTHIINGILDFTYAENTGAAFGMFSGGTWFLTVFTIAVCAGIAAMLIFYWKNFSKLTRFSLAMILSGAVGNLIDRLMLGMVVDFIELTFVNFAIFNIADIFITMGTILLILSILFTEMDLKKKNTSDETAD